MIEQYLQILEKIESQQAELNKTRDLVFERLNNDLKKQRGKPIIIDVSQLPKEITLNKWFYYFDNMNIEFLDLSK